MTEKRADIVIAAHSDPSSLPPWPDWLKQRLEWYQDLKFGLFLHWGLYSQWGCIESWPLVEEDEWARPDDLACWVERDRDLERFRRDYRALNRTFNPQDFDPSAWAAAAEDAGMKYVCFTTKHHDGFCLFDTQTTDYRITHPDCPFSSDPRANVVREVFDAFRRRDFGISCYFSKSDWHCPWYWIPGQPAPDRNPNYNTAEQPEVWEQFVQFVHAQVRELMRDYGHIDILWLDGGQVRPPDQDIRMAEMAAMARELQPGLIMVDRTVGGEFENIITPEQEIPDAPLGQAWESCLTMGDSWSYKPNENYKSTRELIHMLADIVAKGGNFILNIGPDSQGRLPEESLTRLREIGDWMRVNGEAIYGSRVQAPYAHDTIRYTTRDGLIYALILSTDEQGERPPAQVRLQTPPPPAGDSIVMLGEESPLTWKIDTDNRVVVQLPPAAEKYAHAWVLRYRPQQ